MSQALYRKFRPQRWDQVVGQEHVVSTLQNAVRSQRIGHAYLFAGPRGTGKTTLARLLAKAFNCLADDLSVRPCEVCAHCKAINKGSFLDLIEIDAASNTSVDDVRDLRDKINFSPTQGRFKVYIIDEVHMLSTAAFNALLKTLEEPPAHAIFILATTEIHKIPATVLSRCQRHEFRRIPVNDIVSCLKDIAGQEGITVDDDALIAIARQATGALRDAISLLDQLASTGERITLEIAQNVLGTVTDQAILELVDAILRKDPQAGLTCLHQALDRGSDARQFARQMVDYLRQLLLIQMGNREEIDATADMLARMSDHAGAFSRSMLLDTLNAFNQATSDLRAAWQPSLPLELALARVINQPETNSVQLASISPNSRQNDPAPKAEAKPAQKKTAQAAAELQQNAPLGHLSPPAADRESVPESAMPEANAAPPPPAEMGTPAADIDLSAIQKNWKEIRSVVRETSRPTEALLNSCKLITVKNGVLILGFTTRLLQSKMNTPENLELTHNAIHHLLGIQVPIMAVVTHGQAAELPPDLEIDADGLVNAALSLGGKITKQD